MSILIMSLLSLLSCTGVRAFSPVVVFKHVHTSRSSFSASTSRIFSSSIQKVVVLEQGKAKLFQDGNPLVYGGAVKEIQGDPQAGDDVYVNDYKGNNIGRGFFNPYSQYRVRMITRNHDEINKENIADILEYRLQNAIDLRKVIGLPSSIKNTAYRLVNGEGDRLSGLIIDIFGNRIIVQSTSLWVELHRTMITSILTKLFDQSSYIILWRQQEARLKQDGFNSTSFPSATSHQFEEVKLAEENIIILENGVKFNVNTENSQKTGFYCDQRENRAMLGSISQNKNVLDLYCYSAGFSIYAALNGATNVTAVDSSIPALDTALLNAKLNKVDHIVNIVKADAIDYMNNAFQNKDFYDIVICDPPKLAPTRKDLDRATSKYTKINAAALRILKPGGLLLTCSCSAAMTQSGEFTNMLKEASKIARRDITILTKSSTGGDHPVHIAYPEGAYLTAVLLRVQ